ncbi:MAG TPA: 30S ribosomal protein S17 [Verrucomicrobiae bacterium]|nr:30S ribosomal protein S17 [Verrucomicrobiae bacterium]
MAKKVIGTVTSDVQDKTIVVTATRRVTHPVYGKQSTKTQKYAADDPKNEAHVGDLVEISEIPPKSKNKTWKLDRIIETGHGSIELVEETA